MKVFRLTLCIILCVAVLSCSLSVFAVDPTPSPTPTSLPGYDDLQNQVELNNTLMSYFVWLLLNSWGIRITYRDLTEFNEFVEENIVNWVIEYLADLPSSYSIDEWIAPWQAGYDYWGNFRGNESMLEDIRDFANWLKSKYGLSDESTIIINPIRTYNGAQLYESNKFYSSYDYVKNETTYTAMARSSNVSSLGVSDEPWFFVLHNTYNDRYYFMFIRPVGSNIGMPHYYLGLDSSGNIVSIQSDSYSWSDQNKDNYNFGLMPCYPDANPNNSGGINLPLNFTPIEYYTTETSMYNITYTWVRSISSFTVTYEGNTKIVTTSINVPVEGEDYNDGDSIAIIDGKPQYIVIEWNGEVTVSNLPAIVSTGGVSNPGLTELWRPVAGFVEDMGHSMQTLIGIVYEFPEEVVTPIYVVTGLIVLLGMIKLMREH